MEFLKDLWNFLKERKKWWLVPLKRRNGLPIAALVIGAVSLLIPAVAGVIHRIWDWLSLAMGELTGKLLLTLVYFLILLPLALAARWAGKSGIRRRTGGVTYFTQRNHRYDKEDLQQPW